LFVGCTDVRSILSHNQRLPSNLKKETLKQLIFQLFGFLSQALIEKDWLAFGHKFSDRCGHIQTDPKEISPIFTQLLECTWQLMQQRNDAFEFNERFLLTLHDHVQSCQFGTFVGNCEKDRLDLRLAETTFSLWGFMSNHMNEYLNPLYRPDVDEIIQANLAPQLIK
jgi:myotubularin-related protein 6/7/8